MLGAQQIAPGGTNCFRERRGLRMNFLVLTVTAVADMFKRVSRAQQSDAAERRSVLALSEGHLASVAPP